VRRPHQKMRRILLMVCATAGLAVAAAGCGGGDNGGGSSAASTSTPQATSSAASSSGGGGEVEIKMQNIQFAPKDVTVKVGQKVKWDNEDSVDHNVTAESGADFKSSDFGKGGSFEFTPDKAGTIKYVCTIHPGMTATLNVTQ
jgi:plastocyanin